MKLEVSMYVMWTLLIIAAGCTVDITPKESTYNVTDIRRLACIHGYINGVIDTKHPEDGGTTVINAAAKFCNKEYK